MSDEPTPEEFKELFSALEEGMKEAQDETLQEAWVSLYEMYQGLRKGGFEKSEALELVAYYIYKTVSGSM